MSAETAVGGSQIAARAAIHPVWVRVTHWINAIAILVMAVAAAEAAIGLAIVIAVFRVRGTANVDEINAMKN